VCVVALLERDGPLSVLADASAAAAAGHGSVVVVTGEPLLRELASPPVPSLVVIEDVHWADEATLDAITVIGRRIAELPAVLVLTYREGEVDAAHRLHATVDSPVQAGRQRDRIVLDDGDVPTERGSCMSTARRTA
jgi:hypothetical protein